MGHRTAAHATGASASAACCRRAGRSQRSCRAGAIGPGGGIRDADRADATGSTPTGPPPANLPQTFEDQTLRMVLRTSIGGRRVRISLSNMLNAEPLAIGAAHLGLHAGHGAIAPSSGRPLDLQR